MQLGFQKTSSIGQLPSHRALSHQTHLYRRRLHNLRPGHLPCVNASPKKKAEAEQYLTPFLNNEITETLTGNEHVPEPLWASWCGHVGGVWVGQAAAYCPTSGLAEPIALGEDGKTKLYALQQCCVEEREAAGDADIMVRRTARANSTQQLEKEMAAGGALQFDPTLSVDWEIEEVPNGQEGLFIFDGGSYTAGPVFLCRDDELDQGQESGNIGVDQNGGDDEDDLPKLGSRTILDTDALFRDNSFSNMAANLRIEMEEGEEAEDDEDGEEEESMAELDDDEFEDGEDFDEEDELLFEEEAPPPQGCTTIIEHCMQYGGEQRVRVRLTLASMLVADGVNADASHAELDVNLLRVSICREDWEGAPGKYTSPSQGISARKEQASSAAKRLSPKDIAGFWNVFEVMATTASDVDMRTGKPALIPLYNSREVQRLVQLPGSSFEGEGGVSGGTLWLPHSVAVQLTQGGSSSGLEVATMWSPQEGVLLGVKRRYSKVGELEEVVASTSIRAK